MSDVKKCFFDYKDLKTGKEKKLELEVFETVYEPREDSFLMTRNVDVPANSTTIELGCGCGLISLIAALQGAQVSAVDVNPKAVENTKKNAEKYGVNIKTALSDMFDGVKGKYDYIFFNPPYVPIDKKPLVQTKTEDEKIEMKAVEAEKEGREYIDRFLKDFPSFLNPNGVAYLLNSSKNDIEKTKKKLDKMRFKYEIVEEENLFFEKLYLFKIWK